jgi:hypothetical protein
VNKGLYGPKEDSLGVRYSDDMKRRYGVDPQFPVQRYVDGIRSSLVPDRTGEHFTPDNKFSSTYVGRKTCRNPIYADDLPTDPNGELCKLKPGPRTSDMVLFEVIGGVPWQLLTDDPNDPSSPYKSTLDAVDWGRILGKDPATHQLQGIDPHMIESVTPRPGVACATGSTDTCDPIHGREWDTTTSKTGLELQYACTFPLLTPKDCTKLPEGATCDCGAGYAGPLCEPNPSDGGNKTLQTRGKAFPSIRELRVVEALGDTGIAQSICPRTNDTNNPDFGYQPAMRALVDRMKTLFGPRCYPENLDRSADGTVTCTILTVLKGQTSADQAAACGPRGMPDAHGLEQPDPGVLHAFQEQKLEALRRDQAVVSAADLPPVCEVAQLTPDAGSCPSCTWLGGKPTCADTGAAGWCYVEGGACKSAIEFGAIVPGEPVISCVRVR